MLSPLLKLFLSLDNEMSYSKSPGFLCPQRSRWLAMARGLWEQCSLDTLTQNSQTLVDLVALPLLTMTTSTIAFTVARAYQWERRTFRSRMLLPRK